MPHQAFASTINALFDKQENGGRVAASIVDANFALAPLKTDESPRDIARAIRNDLGRIRKDARGPEREMRFNIDLIRTMITCLEKQAPPPPSFPEPFASYLRTAVLGAKAGLGNASNLTTQLRAAADHAEAIYREANKAFRRFDSAISIAANKRTIEYLKRFNRPEDKVLIAALEKRVAHRTAVHRLLFPTRNPTRAAKLAKPKGRSK